MTGSAPFERGEHRQLLDEDAGRLAHRLFRRDHAVRLDVDQQLVEVGALLDPRALDGVADATHGRERRVEDHAADRLRVHQRAQRAGHVAATLLDLDLHVDLAAFGERRDHVVAVDHLDVVRDVDVGGQHRPRRVLAQRQEHLVAVVQLERDALEVQQQVDDVFAHAVDGRVFVDHARDLDFGGRITDHRGEQHTTERIAEGVAIAPLERLHHDPGVRRPELLHFDDARLQHCCLHIFGPLINASTTRR